MQWGIRWWTVWIVPCLFLLWGGEVWAERRTALVIGNAKYDTAPLSNPANDATDMSTALRQLGFMVTLLKDADRRTMDKAIEDFHLALRQGGVGLFYFAGHGVQIQGENYLIPVRVQINREQDVQYEAVPVGRIVGSMEDARNALNVVILDACRNNPFGRGVRTLQRGLATTQATQGFLLAYATSPGKTSDDGTERNGLYTSQVLRHITTPGLSIEEVFKRVRIGVAELSRNQQIPWESSSLTGDFYFVSGTSPTERQRREQDALEARRQAEEQRRQAEAAQRQAEERRRQEAAQLEAQRQAEEQRRQAEAAQRQAEERRRQEAAQLETQRQVEERRRQEAAQLEAQRQAEEQRRQAEAAQREAQRQAEERRRQELAQAEAQRAREPQAAAGASSTQLASLEPDVAKREEKIGRFIRYTNGTALDTQTNLMWMTQDFRNMERRPPRDWDEAMAWAAKMNQQRYAGYSDWEVPTTAEYETIYHKEGRKQAHNGKAVGYPEAFADGGGVAYWGREIVRENVALIQIYGFSFTTGRAFQWYKTESRDEATVRLVRQGRGR